ncbi:DMT family transporter [Alicyclobacillus dauci]|uniref:DMT family transporter n=1 Tax=Alicyclobacillus dauci TaxID=1475485 RepID=A0ABY6YZI4_9BACL|nr:DMT family transporter [Alicyclobacillus dauci]WAH35874.1 DMT family transporter [Alicyclobacillus dauci]
MRQSRVMSALLIIVLVVLWGISFAIYKVALNYAPPLIFAGIRTLLGGIVVLMIALLSRKQPNFIKHFWVYAISAVFNVILFFGLQTVGLNYLPAGLFSVLIYLEPVLVGVFAWLWLGEQMTWRKVVGLIFGFMGVAAISARSLTSHVSGVGILIGILTAVFWAIGTVYTKRAQERVDMMWLLAIQFLIGGILITIAGSATESWGAVTWSAPFILGTLFGGFFGIALSWMIWFYLVKSGDASRVAAITFLVPLIAVVTSVLFLHEAVSVWLVFGLILIILGIYLTNTQKKRISEIPPVAHTGVSR